MPIPQVDKIWMDGKLVDWEDATVHVLTHALHYGSGVFEGVRAYRTDQGAAVCAFRPFPDHHPYSRGDVDELRHWARQQPADCVVVTTQKDLVKLRLPDLAGRPLWALRIRLQGLNEGSLEALDEKLHGCLLASKNHLV